MNKQALLNNFVQTAHEHGQAMENDECAYFPEDHPGCAIGCQPGFREEFQDIMTDGDTAGETIQTLIHYDDIGRRMKKFFKIRTEVDERFLSDLQGLHDARDNWKRSRLTAECVDEFCDEWKLRVPKH